MEWPVQEVTDTAAVAKEILSARTPQGSATVIALHGDLGAGKTTFTQQLAALLGVGEPITSPTFVIMKGYDTDAPWEQLIHIDAYRLDSPDELARLGFSELCQQPNIIICIEWAERVADLLPADTLHLTFTMSENGRIISDTHG